MGSLPKRLQQPELEQAKAGGKQLPPQMYELEAGQETVTPNCCPRGVLTALPNAHPRDPVLLEHRALSAHCPSMCREHRLAVWPSHPSPVTHWVAGLGNCHTRSKDHPWVWA